MIVTHTIRCQAASIIAAVENLRDAEGMELSTFRHAMESGLLLAEADDYLATGLMTCTCELDGVRA